MALSVKTRFEVFKRDRFTCAYCGKHPPDVLLEADHVIPLAAGGSSEMENLVTACWDCNHGKGARLLEEGIAPTAPPLEEVQARIQQMQDRIEQAEAYARLTQELRDMQERLVRKVIEAWANAFGAERVERQDGNYWQLRAYEEWPAERSIRGFVQKLPLFTIIEAVDMTAARFNGISNEGTCRYFYAICWRHIRAAD